eukprot:3630045-Amphidinium_carterae.1
MRPSPCEQKGLAWKGLVFAFRGVALQMLGFVLDMQPANRKQRVEFKGHSDQTNFQGKQESKSNPKKVKINTNIMSELTSARRLHRVQCIDLPPARVSEEEV